VGCDPANSSAFRFVPNPKATFVRSLGTGVLLCDAASPADEILENPGFGTGSGWLVLIIDGPEVIVADTRPSLCDNGCGAGRVMNPVSKG
jgi:hypothetical protein